MAVTAVSGMTLSKFLKIVSKGMVYNNLSSASPMWDFVMGHRVEDPMGREHRFLVRTALGVAAAQFGDVNGATFPTAQKASLQEANATFKNIMATVEVERTLIELAKSDLSKYGAPLAEELEAKGIAAARILSGAAYRDGTGVIGQVASAAVSSPNLVVTLAVGASDRGHVGWFDMGDIVKFADESGTAQNVSVSSGSISYYQVVDKDRDARTVSIGAFDSSGTQLTVSAANEIEVGDVIYRTGTAAIDLTAIAASTERNTLSYEFAGLQALAATSGTVHGLSYGGNIKGTVVDHSGAAIDSSAFQKLLSKLSITCGEGRYQWKKALMAHEVYDALIDAAEVDRRFVSSQDASRGFKKMGYQDGSNFVEFVRDEFCPFQNIWLMPEGKDVLGFIGTDMKPVKAESGSEFHLKPTSGSYQDVVQHFIKGMGVMISKHPAAIGKITNFTF